VKKVVSLWAAIVAGALATPAATAETTRYVRHIEQEIDTHQVGWIDVDVRLDGKVTLHAGFSNGKQWAGNNFYAITTFRGKDGKVIKSVSQAKGLDGSMMGHAREGDVTNTFMLTPSELLNFDHVEFQAGVTNCGMEVFSMHNLNDRTFTTRKCEKPPGARDIPMERLWRKNVT
jgi:hypothetical protein